MKATRALCLQSQASTNIRKYAEYFQLNITYQPKNASNLFNVVSVTYIKLQKIKGISANVSVSLYI